MAKGDLSTSFEHDEGFAYRLGDVYSEPFASHAEALTAARQAAGAQQLADGDCRDQLAGRERRVDS